MKKIILVLVLITLSLQAHDNETHVIIDTDMGIDDIRAVLYLSKLYNIEIIGFIGTDGVQSHTKATQNLRRLLKSIDNNVPVYQGIASKNKKIPKFREFAYNLNWNELPEVSAKNNNLSQLVDILKDSKTRITYIALGPLTNLDYLLNNVPNLKDRIDNIYFSGGLPEYTENETWNYLRDTTSANDVLEYKDIPFYSFVLKDIYLPIFDHRSWNKIIDSKNTHIEVMEKLFFNQPVLKHMFVQKGMYKAYDDIIPVFLDKPSLATFDKVANNRFVLLKWDKNLSNTKYYLRMKEQYEKNLIPRPSVSFLEFPVDIELYSKDIAEHLDLIIDLYGLEEWKSVVLTNELHRHLGTYSIIGAKMGIRARELLRAGLDDLRVTAYAGTEPPYSCLNDGLQVSTGASIGRGTIKIDDKNDIKAEFVYGDSKVILELKDKIKEKIDNQIEEAKELHGNLTVEYFDYIRQVSIMNWMDLNRAVIFEEEVILAEPSNN